MDARIIPLSEQYKSKLINYMHKVFPSFSEAFIQYDVNEAIKGQKTKKLSFIAVNEKDEIVGCHMNFLTKAWIKGEEKVIAWGHNTYLDEEYRRQVGMDLILEIVSFQYGFGYGLTDINFKIQHLIKTNIFINGLRKYCKINKWYLWSNICKLLKIKRQIPPTLPSAINYGQESFHLCEDAKEIIIPNRGFWYKDICEVDFIRDYDFLNKRFFQNPVCKYYTYTNLDRNCYFVIRPIIYQGMIGIQIADIRYKSSQPEQAKIIHHSIEKLCSNIHAGVLLFTTSDKTIKSMYEHDRLCKSYPVALICHKKHVSSAEANIIVNAADSDDEFYKYPQSFQYASNT